MRTGVEVLKVGIRDVLATLKSKEPESDEAFALRRLQYWGVEGFAPDESAKLAAREFVARLERRRRMAFAILVRAAQEVSAPDTHRRDRKSVV